jgi:hypothetical protein
MGQTTVGVLYGIKAPAGVVLRDERYRAPIATRGLLDRWEHECNALIEAHDEKLDAWVMAKPGRMPYQREDGTARYVPDHEYDGGDLVGFWIAAGASGKDGLPRLRTLVVSKEAIRTTEPYARAYRNARRRWRRFAKWAAAQGVTLPKPRLWVTETEVA